MHRPNGRLILPDYALRGAPPFCDVSFQPADEEMNLENLVIVWQGTIVNDYAEASVTGTLAVALRAMGVAETTEEAQQKANALWAARDREYLPLKG